MEEGIAPRPNDSNEGISQSPSKGIKIDSVIPSGQEENPVLADDYPKNESNKDESPLPKEANPSIGPEEKKPIENEMPTKDYSNLCLIFGLLAFFLSAIPVVGTVLSIMGIVYFAKGRKQSNAKLIIGLILSIFGLVGSIISIIYVGMTLLASLFYVGTLQSQLGSASENISSFQGIDLGANGDILISMISLECNNQASDNARMILRNNGATEI